MKNVLKVSVLLALFAASGCTTIEYVPVTPECSPVPSPSLPEIDRGDMWDKLGEDTYRSLQRYIDGVWGYADENAAIVEVLCEENVNGS